MPGSDPITVDECIIVSAVYSGVLGNGTITEVRVREYAERTIKSIHKVSPNLRLGVIVARVCAALSHMDLLESPCIDK